jgi:hypothetical protein
LENKYKCEVVEKSKGFYIVRAENRWQETLHHLKLNIGDVLFFRCKQH